MLIKNITKRITQNIKFIFFIFLLTLDYTVFSENNSSQKKQIIESSNQDFLTKNKEIDFYIAVDFIDALAKQDRMTVYEKFPYLQGYYNGILDYDFEWYETVSNFEGLIINITEPEKHQTDDLYLISIGTPVIKYNKIYFSEFVKEKTKLSFNTWNYEGQQRQIIQFDYYSEVNNFSDEEKKYTYEVELIFDGDYVDFYLYGEFIHRFCKLNEKTYKQLFSLFQENKVDLTKVTWPKHADGSCDFNTEDLLTNAKLSSFMYNQQDIPIYDSPSTDSNVICNLKKGSKVLIQRIGKKEKIDNLEDNWVQVNIQVESQGVTETDYVIGETGWCYAGYLKDTITVDNNDSKKKEEIKINGTLQDESIPHNVKKSHSKILIAVIYGIFLLIIFICILILKKSKSKK